MHESIVFCSTCTVPSLKKFTFAISSPDEFLVPTGGANSVSLNPLAAERPLLGGEKVKGAGGEMKGK